MITSQIETLEQAKYFINQLSDSEYTAVLSPHFTGSAGAHIRHIVDHFLALKNNEHGVVNYNARHRFCAIESSKEVAIKAINEIQHWLENLSSTLLYQRVTVLSEVSVTQTLNYETQSTYARELMFVSSHAVHHYAMLKLIASMQGVNIASNFGLAPATLSFAREQQGAKNLTV